MSLISSRACLASFSLLAAFATACTASSTPERISPTAQVIGSVSSAMSTSLSEINGFYTNCAGTTDGQAWSLSPMGSPTTTHPALSVRTNDVACELSISDVVYEGASYAASPHLSNLQSFWGATASAFKPNPSDPGLFFGNAIVTDRQYTDQFHIIFLMTDKPRQEFGTVYAPPPVTVETAHVGYGVIQAPNYSVDPSFFTLQVNEQYVVTTVGGHVQLGMAGMPGEDFTIVNGEIIDPTAESVGTLWAGSDVASLGSLSDLQIPAESFSLVGADLAQGPVYRTIVIRHHEPVLDLSSYELIRIAFVNSSN